MTATSEIYDDDQKVAPSYARMNKKYHVHRTSAWQDPTGKSRYSLCGVQIGPIGREVTVSAVRNSKFANRFCKSCVKLFAAGGR